MNARAYTTNTTKEETSPDFLGRYHKGWTTYRIKAEKFLKAIGEDVTPESIEEVESIFIRQEGKGDWGAYIDGALVGAGCTLNECLEYIADNHF
jgi:hypothetical protein